MKIQTFFSGKKSNGICKLIGCFCVSSLLLGAGFLSSPAEAAQRVGVAAAVQGDVSLTPQNGAVRPAKSGGDINFQETVKSGPKSGLQVMLLDETTLTLGEDAELTIDEMVYDPAGQSQLALSVTKGIFRYISGRIAAKNPENVSIKTPVGDIGIRGTNLTGVKTGDTWFFGLLGPGPKNNTGNKAGGFVFKNDQGSTEVRRAGYGFTVKPGEAPGAVVEIPIEVVSQLQSRTVLSATAKQHENDTSSESDSGQESAEGKEKGAKALAAEDDANALDEENQEIAQQAISSSQFLFLSGSDISGFSGSATYTETGVAIRTDLRAQSQNDSGLTTAAQEAVNAVAFAEALSGNALKGTYDFSVTANFSTRAVTGNFTNITASSFGISSESVTVNGSYANSNELIGIESVSSGVGTSSAFRIDVDISFLKNGVDTPFALSSLEVKNVADTQIFAGGFSITDAQ